MDVSLTPEKQAILDKVERAYQDLVKACQVTLPDLNRRLADPMSDRLASSGLKMKATSSSRPAIGTLPCSAVTAIAWSSPEDLFNAFASTLAIYEKSVETYFRQADDLQRFLQETGDTDEGDLIQQLNDGEKAVTDDQRKFREATNLRETFFAKEKTEAPDAVVDHDDDDDDDEDKWDDGDLSRLKRY